MRNKLYLKDKKALACFKERATADFWDKHWDIDNVAFRNLILHDTSGSVVIPMVKKYLPAGSTILEGGCGRGQIVYALKNQGYKVIGVDYAQSTILKIKKTFYPA